MTLKEYERRKQELLEASWRPRSVCRRCRRPQTTCFCRHIRAFSSSPQFVFLIHRDEKRRSVATGWMSHLCLSNSRIFEGTDFTGHPEVEEIFNDPNAAPVLLYPSPDAVDIDSMNDDEKASIFPAGRRAVVFIIDGTWAQARRMLRLSTRLRSLPAIRFTPKTQSAFQVRKQPRPECFSTIESVHYLIDRLSKDEKKHHNLLEVFSVMVQQQIDYGHRSLIRR